MLYTIELGGVVNRDELNKIANATRCYIMKIGDGLITLQWLGATHREL